MLSNNAAAENWNAWLDDLPISAEFHPAIDRLQDFIAGLAVPTPAAQPDPREAALRDIARQKRSDEMDTEYDVEYAEFEGGYNAIIDVARVALPAVQPAHVNETPKIEHDAANMLTPATKGGGA